MGFLGDAWDWAKDKKEEVLFAPIGGHLGGPLAAKWAYDNAGALWDKKGAIAGGLGGAVVGGPGGAIAGYQAGSALDQSGLLGGLDGKKKGGDGGANFTPAQQQSIDMRNRYADALSGYQSQGSPFIQTTTKAPGPPKPTAAGGMTDEERRAYLAALSGRGRAF